LACYALPEGMPEPFSKAPEESVGVFGLLTSFHQSWSAFRSLTQGQGLLHAMSVLKLEEPPRGPRVLFSLRRCWRDITLVPPFLTACRPLQSWRSVQRTRPSLPPLDPRGCFSNNQFSVFGRVGLDPDCPHFFFHNRSFPSIKLPLKFFLVLPGSPEMWNHVPNDSSLFEQAF